MPLTVSDALSGVWNAKCCHGRGSVVPPQPLESSNGRIVYSEENVDFLRLCAQETKWGIISKWISPSLLGCWHFRAHRPYMWLLEIALIYGTPCPVARGLLCEPHGGGPTAVQGLLRIRGQSLHVLCWPKDTLLMDHYEGGDSSL